MARGNVSIVTGYDADPAEMRAMKIAEERLAWMDKHMIVKHRSGMWSQPAMAEIAEKAGIRFELKMVVR